MPSAVRSGRNGSPRSSQLEPFRGLAATSGTSARRSLRRDYFPPQTSFWNLGFVRSGSKLGSIFGPPGRSRAGARSRFNAGRRSPGPDSRCCGACRRRRSGERDRGRTSTRDRGAPRRRRSRSAGSRCRRATGVTSNCSQARPGTFISARRRSRRSGSKRFDAPEIERVARAELLGAAPPAAKADASGEQVEEPAQAPEKVAVVPAGVAADATDRREGRGRRKRQRRPCGCRRGACRRASPP